MADDISSQLDDLNKLAPDARARVSNALKTSIASELNQQASTPMRAAEFSKGAFFSRSKDNAMLDESAIIQQAATMDAASFAKFAQNLQSLKSLKSGQ